MNDLINNTFHNHKQITEETLANEGKKIELVSELCVKALSSGHKILIFGNGGSAADAQHIAAELIGRFKLERRALPCVALTTDTSTITAIGNDYGFSEIFARQIEALACKDDIIIGISTSGTSVNVIKAFEKAGTIGCTVIGLTGKNTSMFDKHSKITLSIPSSDTARIQEMHILIGHLLCELIETGLFPKTEV